MAEQLELVAIEADQDIDSVVKDMLARYAAHTIGVCHSRSHIYGPLTQVHCSCGGRGPSPRTISGPSGRQSTPTCSR